VTASPCLHAHAALIARCPDDAVLLSASAGRSFAGRDRGRPATRCASRWRAFARGAPRAGHGRHRRRASSLPMFFPAARSEPAPARVCAWSTRLRAPCARESAPDDPRRGSTDAAARADRARVARQPELARLFHGGRRARRRGSGPGRSSTAPLRLTAPRESSDRRRRSRRGRDRSESVLLHGVAGALLAASGSPTHACCRRVLAARTTAVPGLATRRRAVRRTRARRVPLLAYSRSSPHPKCRAALLGFPYDPAALRRGRAPRRSATLLCAARGCTPNVLVRCRRIDTVAASFAAHPSLRAHYRGFSARRELRRNGARRPLLCDRVSAVPVTRPLSFLGSAPPRWSPRISDLRPRRAPHWRASLSRGSSGAPGLSSSTASTRRFAHSRHNSLTSRAFFPGTFLSESLRGIFALFVQPAMSRGSQLPLPCIRVPMLTVLRSEWPGELLSCPVRAVTCRFIAFSARVSAECGVDECNRGAGVEQKVEGAVLIHVNGHTMRSRERRGNELLYGVYCRRSPARVTCLKYETTDPRKMRYRLERWVWIRHSTSPVRIRRARTISIYRRLQSVTPRQFVSIPQARHNRPRPGEQGGRTDS